MKETWDALIERAEYLAAQSEATEELLRFYAKLLRVQSEIYESLRSRKGWLPTGVLAADLAVVRTLLPDLLRVVEAHGPAALGVEAQALLRAGVDEIDALLLMQWRAPTDAQFFPKAFLQPYARWLVASGGRPRDRAFERHESRCPFCGGQPQVSFLQTREVSAESGNRELICATCLTAWPFRRVVCAYCCEERPAQLGYFHSPEFAHIRVEACDTCNRYIKGVDLTLVGRAVPLVDEVAAAPLDLWAQEHGYTKIELNLVGL
ncbi:MAG: formate dehydrogenase accessory protein FdhE [Pyrinomonadaceae bacterium]